jgi:hypothetical protein
MRRSIIGAAAIALLSSTALVSAQQSPGGDSSKKEQGANPGGGSAGAERSPSGNQSAPERKDQSRAQAPDDKGAKGDRSAEPKDKARDTKRNAEPKDKAGDTKRSAEPKDKAGDRDRAADSKDKAGDTKRSAEPKDKAGDRDRAADKDRLDRDRGKDTARDRDQDRKRDQAQGKDGQPEGARVNLSQDQRTQVRTRLSSHREARVTNVNFSINIGTRVPRDFRAVHVIPSDIVAIVPQYRGYRYFIYEERVVIIHPERYEIVEVIEVDSGPRRGGAVTATLSLTPPQRTLIVERLPRDRIARDVNIDLALGAELPSSLELYEFPEEIIVEVPALKPYRYVVLERRVAVVDPSNRAVIEVLDR